MESTNLLQVYKIIEKIRSENGRHGSREQEWIEERLIDDNLQKVVAKLSIVALHILSALETKSKTGVELATELQVTRGGITRAAKKLLQFELITAKKALNDKKKIYYALTSNGKVVAKLHDEMHQEIITEIEEKFSDKYSENELKTIIRFLHDLREFEDNFS